jgi:hypothetical protein
MNRCKNALPLDVFHPLRRGSGGGMYTRKAYATRGAPWDGGEVRSTAEAG